MIGNSQNFFRARKNAHISMMNDIYYTSELIFHRIGCRAWRCSINPVRFLTFFEAESQDVFPCKAHYQTGRCDDTKKHKPEDDRVYDSTEYVPQAAPYFVKRSK